MLAQVVLALAIGLHSACVERGRDTAPHPPAKRVESVTVTGTLTDEGVECRALRGDDGARYTLTGDLKGFKTGDRVTVTGTTAEVSTCQQGTTIAVQTIERAKTP